MTELEKNGVTPEEIVWVLLCQGKTTIEQALKFHMKEITLEDLLKQIRTDE